MTLNKNESKSINLLKEEIAELKTAKEEQEHHNVFLKGELDKMRRVKFDFEEFIILKRLAIKEIQ